MTALVLEAEPAALDVVLSGDRLIVNLVDGRSLSIPLHWYPRLLAALSDEPNHWVILGAGDAIEWPDLDEPIGIEGLLAGRRSGESEQSFLSCACDLPAPDVVQSVPP